MLSLLAALIFAQAVPPPVETKPQDPPKPVEAKPPQEAPRGLDLRVLTETVSKVTKKDFLAEGSIEVARINMTPSASLSPDELFSFYASALATCGYGLMKDPSAANRYHVLKLGQPLPVTPAEYTDPAKLPDTEELCTLTLKLKALSPNSAYVAVMARLHPRLSNLCVRTVDSVSFVDFAPTLKHIARLLADADAAAALSLIPFDLDVFVVSVQKGLDSPSAPSADLKELLPLIRKKVTIDEKTGVLLEGGGNVRITPKDAGYLVQTTLALGIFDVRFNVGQDRGTLKFEDLTVTKQVEKHTVKVCATSLATMKEGEQAIIGSWRDEGVTNYLIIRATQVK